MQGSAVKAAKSSAFQKKEHLYFGDSYFSDFLIEIQFQDSEGNVNSKESWGFVLFKWSGKDFFMYMGLGSGFTFFFQLRNLIFQSPMLSKENKSLEGVWTRDSLPKSRSSQT